MDHDRQIKISVGASRRSIAWPTQAMTWAAFADKLREPQRTTETFTEYMAMPKSKQDEIKDVGGFVGGAMADGRRKSANVLTRELITLDMDAIPMNEDETILELLDGFGCTYAVYSTRKHSKQRPRLRVILPTDRSLSAEEYEPIARKIASFIGMQYADPTTFEPERLMYWPSCSADSDYLYKYKEGPFLAADGILGMFEDWRDVASWPAVPGKTPEDHTRLAQKQGDPQAKKGVVGAFCRAYDVLDAMEAFIPGRYEPAGQDDRMTYVGGSTTGGAIIYDNGNFLYSHHATDPCGGKLVNAFDLVRLHLYGDEDDEAKPGTPGSNLPSYRAMMELAAADPTVQLILGEERLARAAEEFDLPAEMVEAVQHPEGQVVDAEIVTRDSCEAAVDWRRKLEKNAQGVPASTIANVKLVLGNDPAVAGCIALDIFANRGVVNGPLPWDNQLGRRPWSDVDDAGLRNYLESAYGIASKDKIYDGLALTAYANRFDDVADYLNGLEWDGEPRLDRLLIDYLGAEDSIYTRAVARKSLTAAVARVMVPGTKFDYMTILTGRQGIGKSTLLRHLGKQWYSDSLTSFEGKEAAEMVQGVWINELGELNGLNKSETNAVKQFLSKNEDLFRVPYGRRTEVFKRRCVFFGTSNDIEFLRDRTGNRRFWPVDVGVEEPIKSVFEDLPDEVNQIWAEAVINWRAGEQLYLTGEEEEIALDVQDQHKETNSKEGLIEEYLDTLIPDTWNDLDIQTRRSYYHNIAIEGVPLVERTTVSAVEVWAECFGQDVTRMRRMDSAEINSILQSLKGWRREKTPRRVGPYGSQRIFSRI